MNTLIFLFFRRMRAPLLVLICAYAISIGGLVLIPGVDDQGQPWQFDFLHAFYFVSFMGSTIGFGEIPYTFTPGQRLWTTFALYICVISWLYAIGKILAILQDTGFQRVVTEQRFTRSVQQLRAPFYLICGYGETGNLLVKELNEHNKQCVVIDSDPERINELMVDNLNFDVPYLCCTARETRHLIEAGLQHDSCQAVLALTNDAEINAKIAITAKLLRPELTVISRANTKDAAANLASFNTDHIINPFTVFADHLAMALRIPSVHLLYKWLITSPGAPLPASVEPPRGTWIICGFGRFGRAVHQYLDYEGIPVIIIEPDAEQAPKDAIIGRGTEAVTLRAAGINKAVGLVAGADQDINNLSIIMTAKELNPELYIVARQNRRANDSVFKAAGIDLIMESSRILLWRILPLLTTPLLRRFLLQARHHNEQWAHDLLTQLNQICNGHTPYTWSIVIDTAQAPGVVEALSSGQEITLHHLLCNPYERDQPLPGHALLIVRDDDEMLLPSRNTILFEDDQILLCARYDAVAKINNLLNNASLLNYIVTGIDSHDSYIWRWLPNRFGRQSESP